MWSAQKILARSVQLFWRLLDTNKQTDTQTDRQAKFIYRLGFKSASRPFSISTFNCDSLSEHLLFVHYKTVTKKVRWFNNIYSMDFPNFYTSEHRSIFPGVTWVDSKILSWIDSAVFTFYVHGIQTNRQKKLIYWRRSVCGILLLIRGFKIKCVWPEESKFFFSFFLL